MGPFGDGSAEGVEGCVGVVAKEGGGGTTVGRLRLTLIMIGISWARWARRGGDEFLSLCVSHAKGGQVVASHEIKSLAHGVGLVAGDWSHS